MKTYQIEHAADMHAELCMTLRARGIPLDRAEQMADSSMPVLVALAAQFEPAPRAADFEIPKPEPFTIH